MKHFRYVLEVLVMLSVGITILRIYLQLNQKWKWKHDKNVAESISVLALTIGFVAYIPFLVKFVFIDKDASTSVNTAFGMFNCLALAAIGIGIWISENKGKPLSSLFVQSIRSEKKEKGNLIKSFIKPKGSEQVVEILRLVSLADNEVAEKEVKLINQFCEQWKISPPDMKVGKAEQQDVLIELRKNTAEYLKAKPSPEQATQLLDILELMIKADGKTTEEEEIIFGELSGMINNYVSEEDLNETRYEALLIPQSKDQAELIQNLLPNAKPTPYRGGEVFRTQKFYSESYAEAVCQKYIQQGVFAVAMEI